MAAFVEQSLGGECSVQERLNALDYCYNVLVCDKALMEDIGWTVLAKILQNCLPLVSLSKTAHKTAMAMCSVISPKLCHLACMESLTMTSSASQESIHCENDDDDEVVDGNQLTESYLSLFARIMERPEMTQKFRMQSTSDTLAVLLMRFDPRLHDSFVQFVWRVYIMTDTDDDQCSNLIKEAFNGKIRLAALKLLAHSREPRDIIAKFRSLLHFQHCLLTEGTGDDDEYVEYGKSILCILLFGSQSPAVWTSSYAFHRISHHIANILMRNRSPEPQPLESETLELAYSLLDRCPANSLLPLQMEDFLYCAKDNRFSFLQQLISFMAESPSPKNRFTAYRLLECFLLRFDDQAQLLFFTTLLRDQSVYGTVKTALIQLLQKRIRLCDANSSPLRSRAIVDILIPIIFDTKTLESEQHNISYHLQSVNFLLFLLLLSQQAGVANQRLSQSIDEILLKRLQKDYLQRLRVKSDWGGRSIITKDIDALFFCLDRVNAVVAELS